MYVDSGAVVNFDGCDIYSNTATDYVILQPSRVPWPLWNQFPGSVPHARRVVACTLAPARSLTLMDATFTQTRPDEYAHAPAPHSMAPMEVVSRN